MPDYSWPAADKRLIIGKRGRVIEAGHKVLARERGVLGNKTVHGVAARLRQPASPRIDGGVDAARRLIESAGLLTMRR